MAGLSQPEKMVLKLDCIGRESSQGQRKALARQLAETFPEDKLAQLLADAVQEQERRTAQVSDANAKIHVLAHARWLSRKVKTSP